MDEMIKDLKKILSGAVKGSAYKGLLFSGGLDTSILAAIKPRVIGITVSLKSEGEDIHYSKKLGDGEKTCPGCGAGINMDGFHCRICGHVMDWRL